MTKKIETEVVTEDNEVVAQAKQPLPSLEVAMNPRGQYFIAHAGTQNPLDANAGIYTDEKRAQEALHTLKENW